MSAERAVEAGRLLAEAKTDEGIPRGGWERWVEDVAGVPPVTARRYIQLFNAVSEGTISVADITEAGQIAALKTASSASESTPPQPPLDPTESEIERMAEVTPGCPPPGTDAELPQTGL
jgi:hypothetical protein